MAETSSKPLENGGNSPHSHHEAFFFPRLSYRENSISPTPNGDGSFRVLYYGGAGSVPFTWESRPGTPKQTSDDRPRAPPLTPPPSYQLGNPRKKHHRHHPRSSKICKSIFSRNGGSSNKSDVVVPTFSPSSSQSSSSHSLPSPPPKGRYPSAAGIGLGRYEPEPESISPSSTLCFGPRCSGDSRMFWDYYDPIKNVKKMVLSIVGHAKNN
ncbi:uncharacterized protein [Henckelia pumila]|uniref:uncharacterized protein n=1 Tax=Henckelia pumila TaxID=405737 RepID=UPI003C6E16D0